MFETPPATRHRLCAHADDNGQGMHWLQPGEQCPAAPARPHRGDPMTDYTKIVIESDTKGRINIACEDDNGAGHGYRLAGPKYSDGGGKPLARVELRERDVKELRLYLAIWDEIQATRTAQEGARL